MTANSRFAIPGQNIDFKAISAPPQHAYEMSDSNDTEKQNKIDGKFPDTVGPKANSCSCKIAS